MFVTLCCSLYKNAMQTQFLKRQRGPVINFWCIPIDKCADNIAQVLVLLPDTLGRQWTSCHLDCFHHGEGNFVVPTKFFYLQRAPLTKTSVRSQDHLKGNRFYGNLQYAQYCNAQYAYCKKLQAIVLVPKNISFRRK